VIPAYCERKAPIKSGKVISVKGAASMAPDTKAVPLPVVVVVASEVQVMTGQEAQACVMFP